MASPLLTTPPRDLSPGQLPKRAESLETSTSVNVAEGTRQPYASSCSHYCVVHVCGGRVGKGSA
jgi:hypothetical protein